MSRLISMLRTGAPKHALVIGSETFSRILDWEDRTTCVLFGDGAGATILRATKSDRGVLASTIRSDGEGACFIQMPGGGSSFPPTRPETLEQRRLARVLFVLLHELLEHLPRGDAALRHRTGLAHRRAARLRHRRRARGGRQPAAGRALTAAPAASAEAPPQRPPVNPRPGPGSRG